MSDVCRKKDSRDRRTRQSEDLASPLGRGGITEGDDGEGRRALPQSKLALCRLSQRGSLASVFSFPEEAAPASPDPGIRKAPRRTERIERRVFMVSLFLNKLNGFCEKPSPRAKREILNKIKIIILFISEKIKSIKRVFVQFFV